MDGKIVIRGRTLFFGMLSVREFATRSLDETVRTGKPLTKEKSVINAIYAGLLNGADLTGEKPPTFEEAYVWAEELMDGDQQEIADIEKCFMESRAGKKLIAMIPKSEAGEEKKSEDETEE